MRNMIIMFLGHTNEFSINFTIESDESKSELVMQAISDFHNKTCIKFEPYDDSQKAFVVVTNENSTGCVSFVGRLGVKQTVDLKVPGCDKASLIHFLI